MKVLLGLLGYSCKIHRKRSKSSINRLSFMESDEHKLERSFSNENSTLENNTNNANKIHASDAEPSTSTSCVQHKENADSAGEKTQNSSNQAKQKDELADQTEGKMLYFIK